MRKETYIKKMAKHEASFDKLWRKIADDTIEFVEKNPEKSIYSLSKIKKFSDYMCLSGAWIQDRINGKLPRDRGALTKKIRKALGFTVY